MSVFFFFFQAEDGIRDFHVTGVQTCALPILLGVPSHEVTVQCLRMGGGFGGKEMQPHGFAAVAALGAKLTGRPVRFRFNRTQDLTMSGKRHGFHATWKIGFDSEGRIQALEATLTADGGWSLDLSEPVLAR